MPRLFWLGSLALTFVDRFFGTPLFCSANKG
jgi:hypothetical protein